MHSVPAGRAIVESFRQVLSSPGIGDMALRDGETLVIEITVTDQEDRWRIDSHMKHSRPR